ncbi:hypothetical protein ACIP98_21095 [Streptomyces sp. NPDC088354]|uniref:hypothetical protein n=1 Tax=Streptomyces sp. NPDC088354 TaxID=3365856 RepID=UPI00380A5A94
MRIWIAIWQGSSRMAAAFWDWALTTPLPRLGGVVVLALVVNGLPFTGHIVGAGVVAWVLMAIVLGLREPLPDLSKLRRTKGKAPESQAKPAGESSGKQPEQPAGEQQPTPLPELSRDELGEYLRALLGPTGGVHLLALAKALSGVTGRTWETRDVRDQLARVGIRVRAGVRAPGVGVREGVHRRDIPPAPPPDQEEAPDGVVAAGQPGNNNTGNTSRLVGGEWLTYQEDPDNPHRTIISRK